MGRKFKPGGASPLSAALGEMRKAGGALVVFSMCLNLLLLTSPIYMMQVFDRVLTSGHTETLLFLTVIAVTAVGVMGALEMARMRLLTRAGLWLERRLAPALIGASMSARLKGEPATAQTLRDLDALRAFSTGTGILALCDAPWMPLFILVLFGLSPWLGLVGVFGGVVLFALALINEQLSRKPLKAENLSMLTDRDAVDQALKNAEAIHAMGMLPGFLQRWSLRNVRTLAMQLDAGERNALMVGISKAFRMMIQILILAVGAALVLKGQLTSGGMIAASIILGRALAPVEQSIGAWKGFVGARQAYLRLQALLTLAAPALQPMRLPSPKGALKCEGVVYAMPGANEPVIKGVDFALEPGTALGIIGPSAAGKSTLCRLLVGVWQPLRGHVRLDGADLGNWAADQLGAHVGYLPQDVELFAGTVKENIARLAPDIDPKKVVEAAMLASVHEMVLGLPQGYDTEIGPGGSFLSGGQRQRIGLARALYGRPRLVVLDEPNANLDSDGEKALLRAMEAAKAWGATVVVVAHQPGILRPMDMLLMLVNGQTRYFGPRDTFMGQLHAVQPAAASAQGPQPVQTAKPAQAVPPAQGGPSGPGRIPSSALAAASGAAARPAAPAKPGPRVTPVQS